MKRSRRVGLLAASLHVLLPCCMFLAAEDEKKPEPPAREETQATVVPFRLAGAYEEAVPEVNPFGPSRLHFRGLLELLRKAARDPKVAAIVLQSESPELGLARVREVVAVLEEARTAGKKIYAYADQPSLRDMILLSQASRLTVSDSTMAIFPGVSAEVLYWKPLFDRLGLRFLVSHVGDYKSAFENFARRSMSPAYREVLEGLIDASYRSTVELIARGRNVPPERVMEAIDRGCLSGADLKELGLVDELAPRDHFWADIKADLGVDRLRVLSGYGRKTVDLDQQNPFTLFSAILEALAPPRRAGSSSAKIAVIYANGMIVSGRSRGSPFGGATLGSETLSDAIKAAAEDETVKAIVLRINSPGGSGVASDAIWRVALEARKKKPLIASMADVAGSGGYYIAMGASRIFAQPDTLTGSIGVVSAFVNMSGMMDLLGVRAERVSRGKNAGSFSPFTDPEQVSLEPLRRVMDGFYWQFVDKAAEGRSKTREEIHAVAQGRVWTGAAALEKGLVDELGGLREAIQSARSLAKVAPEEKIEIVESPPPPNVFEALSELLGTTRLSSQGRALGLDAASSALLQALPALREPLARIEALLEAARDRILLVEPVEIRLD